MDFYRILDIIGEIAFVVMVVWGFAAGLRFFFMMENRAEQILEELKQIKEKLDKKD